MNTRTLLTPLVFTFAALTSAQFNVGGIPYGLRNGLDRTALPTVKAATFDAKAAALADAQREADGQIPYYSRFVAVNAGLANAGRWDALPNGDRIWRLRVESDGALAVELFFEDFFMPAHATLHVYDDDGGQVIGGFTGANNRDHGLFTTHMIMGSSCILEYYEPVAVAGQGRFTIPHVGHCYRMVGGVKADDCEVDVNCSEGANWFDQRDGVVRLLVVDGVGSGYCTGSVVNNVEQDCKSYILTAFHCGVSSSASHFAQWKAYFRYQRNGCGTGTALANKIMTGCVKRADSNDNGGNSGSDFLLIEMDDPIPDTFTPFFAGWSAVNSPSSNGVSIHHPAGDEKKISTYTAALTTSGWGISNTHWRVFWVGTANGWGVTEGGSSGSPIYNNDGLIIGTLTGGGSYCNSVVPGGQNQPDYYGKMSYHWQSNPGPASEHLKEWLDPNGTGTTIMAGSYDPCGTYNVYTGLGDVQAPAAPGVHPNPALDRATVVFPEGITGVERVDLIDVTGRTVRSLATDHGDRMEMDLTGIGNGSYLVRLIAGGRAHAATTLVVNGR